MKKLIETLVKALVDHTEDVKINELEENDTLTYEVVVNPEDLGKIIGKQGRVANALRTVAKAAAIKEHKNIYVKILP